MLKGLATREGMDPKELQSSQEWVTGPRLSHKRHHESVANLTESADIHLRPSYGNALQDLKETCDDFDYLESLREGCLRYADREYHPQEAKLQLLRELVSISEDDIAAMRQRLTDCGSRTKKNMTKFSSRIDVMEELVHKTLAEVVAISDHAGVPTTGQVSKAPARKAKLDMTVCSLRSLTNDAKSKEMLTGSLQPMLQELGHKDKRRVMSKQVSQMAETVASWHRANETIDTHHKRAGPM